MCSWACPAFHTTENTAHAVFATAQTKAVASASQFSPYRPTPALHHTHTRAVFRSFPEGKVTLTAYRKIVQAYTP